jgi:hypothetical protein
MDRTRSLIASALVLLVLAALPPVALGGSAAPAEPCVPGTVWEDLSSGVKYICIYDEQYGGSRWELLSSGQRGITAWEYRSSTLGCLLGTVGLSGVSGGGADSMARSYRWPCASTYDRAPQPVGELRSRVVIQRYGAIGWATCRDSGYQYNTAVASGWSAGIDMGVGADCGSGTYRAVGYGSFFQSAAWRSGSLTSAALYLP